MTPAERDEIRRLWQNMEEPGNKPLWNYYVAMRDPTGTVVALHGPLPTLHDALYSQISYKIDLGDWWLSHGYRVTEVFQANSREEAEIVAAKCKAAASYAYDVGQFQARRSAAHRTPDWYRTRVALGGLIVASVVLWPIIGAFSAGPLEHRPDPHWETIAAISGAVIAMLMLAFLVLVVRVRLFGRP